MIDLNTIRYDALRSSSVTLPKDAQLVGDVLTFERRGKYYMYYDVGATSAKPNAYTKILAKAKKSIKIWDPYFMPSHCAKLFEKVCVDGISIEILSAYRNEQGKSDMEEMLNGILEVLKNNGIKKCSIKANIHKKAKWHDRFLIIDQDEVTQEVYLVGASMDDQIETKKSHGICKIADTNDAKLIINKYTNCRQTVPRDQNHTLSRNLPKIRS